MPVNPRHFILFTVSFLLFSCAGDKKDPSRPAERPKSFSERLNESNGYVQDKQGNWAPRTDKRSSFEMVGESPYFKGEHAKKEYKPGEYRKSSWWGKQEFKKSVWQGETDGSRFQTTARQQGVRAPESGSASDLPRDYATRDFATGAARETSNRGIKRVPDAETEVRRDVYQAPEVMNWRQQRSLTQDQTKSLLGR